MNEYIWKMAGIAAGVVAAGAVGYYGYKAYRKKQFEDKCKRVFGQTQDEFIKELDEAYDDISKGFDDLVGKEQAEMYRQMYKNA